MNKPAHIQEAIFRGDSEFLRRCGKKSAANKRKRKQNKEKFEQLQLRGGDWWND